MQHELQLVAITGCFTRFEVQIQRIGDIKKLHLKIYSDLFSELEKLFLEKSYVDSLNLKTRETPCTSKFMFKICSLGGPQWQSRFP